MTDAATAVREYRANLISDFADLVVDLLTDPELGGGADPWKAIRPLGLILESYEALVLATHQSSSESYAMKDLRGGEADHYRRARHALRALDALYAPSPGGA